MPESTHKYTHNVRERALFTKWSMFEYSMYLSSVFPGFLSLSYGLCSCKKHVVGGLMTRWRVNHWPLCCVFEHISTHAPLSLSVSFGLSSFGWDSHIHLTAQSIIHIWYDEWHEKSIQHTPSEAASSSSSSSSNVHTASYPFLTAISCIDNIFNCIQLLALSLSLWIMAYNLFSCHCWFGLWWWWRRYLYYQQIKRLMVNSAETQTLTSNRLYISFEMLIDLFSFYCVVSIEIAAHCSLFFIFPNFCGDKRILCRTKIA